MDKRKQQSSRIRERRLRRKYQRNIKIAIVVSLILGLSAGFAAGRVTAPRTASSDATDVAPTATSAVETLAPADVGALAPAETDEPAAAQTAQPTDAPTTAPTATQAVESTDAPTAEPTATQAVNALSLDDLEGGQVVSATLLPTVAPTAAPTEAPAEAEAEEVVVPFGETQEISVEINSDGTLHHDGDTQATETLNFSVRVLRYLTPEYYQEHYSTVYALKGNEAGVEFELLLNDYMGDAEINAGNLLPTALETADGTVIQGYVLTATEISVSTLTVETNVPVNGYKRFDYSEDAGDIAYLTITVPDGSGGTVKYMFEVGDPIRPTPTPAPTTSYSTLQSGSTGSSVMRLQERLIELGYLDDTADGNFGSNTEAAVRAAQADFGMEETGVADHDFQVQLYEGE